MVGDGQAYIGRIVNIVPIENADRIESAMVDCGPGGRWGTVIPKQQHLVGDLVEVYLMDSIVPPGDPRFDFLGSKRTKPIRMMRLRGAPSEAIVLPISDRFAGSLEGKDITKATGTTKYIKPVPMSKGSQVLAPMPSYIPKTDEPNFQRVPEMVAALQGQRFIATEKADGTSTTAYLDERGELVVCTRRYIIKPPSPHWVVAEKYKVYEALLSMDGPFALQWETVGPKIQRNRLGLPELEMRLFDIYDYRQHEYFQPVVMGLVAQEHGLKTVRVLDMEGVFDFDDDGLRIYAEGKYESGYPREGVVIRPFVNMRIGRDRLSFKVINLLYK